MAVAAHSVIIQCSWQGPTRKQEGCLSQAQVIAHHVDLTFQQLRSTIRLNVLDLSFEAKPLVFTVNPQPAAEQSDLPQVNYQSLQVTLEQMRTLKLTVHVSREYPAMAASAESTRVIEKTVQLEMPAQLADGHIYQLQIISDAPSSFKALLTDIGSSQPTAKNDLMLDLTQATCCQPQVWTTPDASILVPLKAVVQKTIRVLVHGAIKCFTFLDRREQQFVVVDNQHSLLVGFCDKRKKTVILSAQMQPIDFVDTASDGTVVSVSRNNAIQVWNAQGQLQAHFLNRQPVLCMALSEQWIIIGSADATIQIWDREGKFIKTLEISTPSCPCDRVCSLTVSGDTLVSGHADGTLRFWDKNTGTLKVASKENTHPIVSLTTSALGKIICLSQDSVQIWSPAGNLEAKLLGPSASKAFYLQRVQISPDESLIAAQSADKVIVWNQRVPSLVLVYQQPFNEKENMMTGLRFLQDNRLAVALQDGTIGIWQPLHQNYVTAVLALDSPDSRLAVFEQLLKYRIEDEVISMIRKGDLLSFKSESHLPPLAMAAYYNNSTAVRVLLEVGADVNEKTTKQRKAITALHAAVLGADLAMLTQLIQAGADVNSLDAAGHPPLYYAAVTKKEDFFHALIAAGADLNKLRGSSEVLFGALSFSPANIKMLLSLGLDPNVENEEGMTPIFAAAIEGRLDVLQCLVTAGANPHKKNCSGMTALHMAAMNGHDHLVAWLVKEAMLDPNAQVTSGDLSWATPLTLALLGVITCNTATADIISTLLHAGATIGQSRCMGLPFIHTATLHTPTLAWLLQAFPLIDLEEKEDTGRTLLAVAAQEGELDSVQLLLDRGADPSAKDNTGDTPYVLALRNGHLHVADRLKNAIYQQALRQQEENKQTLANMQQQLVRYQDVLDKVSVATSTSEKIQLYCEIASQQMDNNQRELAAYILDQAGSAIALEEPVSQQVEHLCKLAKVRLRLDPDKVPQELTQAKAVEDVERLKDLLEHPLKNASLHTETSCLLAKTYYDSGAHCHARALLVIARRCADHTQDHTTEYLSNLRCIIETQIALPCIDDDHRDLDTFLAHVDNLQAALPEVVSLLAIAKLIMSKDLHRAEQIFECAKLKLASSPDVPEQGAIQELQAVFEAWRLEHQK